MKTVIDQLRTAFPPQPLDPESAFAEWGGTYQDASSFKSEARGKRWDELSSGFLERHHDALRALGPQALIAVIPAFLAAALRRDEELDMLPTFLLGTLTRSTADGDRFDARFGALATAQRQAIARALEAWESSLEGSQDERAVTEALDSYWREEDRREQ